MINDSSFHYPADLFNLLVEAIPLLNKAKKDVFLFFHGAGVPEQLMQPSRAQWERDKGSISKKDIARQMLTLINEQGDKYLRQRREVLKRVTQFDDFSACWDKDQLPAQGMVAKIQKIVSAKDTVTRLQNEVENERAAKQRQREEEIARQANHRDEIRRIKDCLFALFAELNAQKRGKALEAVLNELFKAHGISIREAFTLKGNPGEGIVEQIDGVIELDGHIYFVEMKWWAVPLGEAQIAEHLIRIFKRAEGRAIIISASDFTAPAVSSCRELLVKKTIILTTLQEIVFLLEQAKDLKEFLRRKAQAAIIDRNPFVSGLEG